MKNLFNYLSIAALVSLSAVSCQSGGDPVAPLAPPTDLAAIGQTHNSVTLTWVSDAEKFEVMLDDGVVRETTSSSFEIDGLEAGTTHTWQVRAGRGDAWSEWVDGPSFTTTSIPLPSGFGVIGITVDSAMLVWEHHGVDGCQVILGEGEPVDLIPGDPQLNPVVVHGVTHLTAETPYTWKVRSCVGDEWTEWVDGKAFATKSTSLFPDQADFIWVEGGSFQMGSTAEWASAEEQPVHEVTVGGFWISKYEVTQSEWLSLIDFNPDPSGGYLDGDDRPAVGMLYEEAQLFVERLNEKTGKTFALPTEAQWEFAARGGNTGGGYRYAGSDDIEQVAWYKGNSAAEGTHEVGTKAPNELGLYDMTGNVMEWCSDWLDTYPDSPQVDPTGPSTGIGHVIRGGGWSQDDKWCHTTFRQAMNPAARGAATGFRLVLIE